MKFSRLILDISLIFLFVFIATYKSLNFFFWHDDFSVLYTVNIENCVYKWPYISYCWIFGFLKKYFYANPDGYFLLGFILFALLNFSFYLLLKQIFRKRIKILLLSLLLASSLWGSEVFFEMYDSISLFSSMTVFIFSLYFFSVYNKHKNKLLLIISLILFALSIPIHFGRSLPYFFIYIGFYWSLQKKFLSVNIFRFIFIVFTIFIILYFLLPLGLNNSLTKSKILFSSTSGSFSVNKINFGFQNLSSFIVTDQIKTFLSEKGIMRINKQHEQLVGIVMVLLGLLFFLKSNRKKLLFIIIFWILIIYYPYSIRSDWYLGTTSRYMFPIVPPFIILIGLLFKKRYYLLVVPIIVANIYFCNQLFGNHLKISLKREIFFNQLNQILNHYDLNKKVIYIDSPENIRSEMVDFVRIGNHPPEATIGFFQNFDYHNFSLFTDSNNLIKISNLLDNDFQIISLFYDGVNIVNTTGNSEPDIQLSKNLDLYKGITFAPTKSFPYRLKFRMNTQLDHAIALPFFKVCEDCKFNDQETWKENIFYINETARIKTNIKITTYLPSPESDDKYLIDGNYDTSWMSNRVIWNEKQKSNINICLDKVESTKSIIIFADQRRKPMKFHLSIDGLAIPFKMANTETAVILEYESVDGKCINININETSNADSPVIQEIDIIPSNLLKIGNVDKLKYTNNSFYVQDESDWKIIENIFAYGVKGCIKWKNNNYGSGQVPFVIKIDTNKYDYIIDLPAMGLGKVDLEIGCINFPVKYNISNVVLESYR